MSSIYALIENSLPVAWIVLAIAFVLLAKCADLFVDSSVSLAIRLKIPRLVVGIVLVSLATTAPELSVSMISALSGKPEMALGNAIGSIICNGGVALALCGIFSPIVIPVIPHVLNTAGGFLLSTGALCFLFVAFDNTLDRWEGFVLVLMFCGYLVYLFRQHKTGAQPDSEVSPEETIVHMPVPRLALFFTLSLTGIIFASKFIIVSATTIALSFGIPETIIALTLVALGTSIPEVATCITAGLKKEGALAVGNILGANIMNICWVAGASAMAHSLTLTRKEILFMFPFMFLIAGSMFLLLRRKYSFTRGKALIMLSLYVLYIASFFFIFPKR